MSEGVQPRDWRMYVDDMARFCDKAASYSACLNRESFALDGMRYDAVLRNLELIGEAATHVPLDVRASIDDVPWRKVIALRNRLIHGYLGIDDDTLWSVVRDDLAPLRAALTRLLAQPP